MPGVVMGQRTPASYEPDIAARTALISAVMWAVVATVAGLVTQWRLMYPDVGVGLEFLSYGRLHAVYQQFVVFGWLTMAGFAALFAILPRLGRAGLSNEILGATVSTFWTLVLFVAGASMLAGTAQGRPLAQLPVIAAAILVVAMVLVFYAVVTTMLRRRERTLYVSAWYLLAAALWLPIVYLVGNVPVFSGVVDAMVSRFYLHGLQFLWLVPVAIGIAYFVVPDATGRPLHSRQLALIGFWSLAFAAPWGGERLGVWGPTPDWAQSIAVAMTIVLLVPVLTAAANLFSTARGRWGLVAGDFGLRFVAAGLGSLIVWTAAVGLSSTRSAARVVGLTTFQAGLDHLAVYGVFSLFAFGLIYHMYPRLTGRAWWSRRLSSVHFWATILAAWVGAGAQVMYGVVQGESLLVWARAGGSAQEVWQQLVLSARAYQAIGLIAFAVLVAAQLVLAYNAYVTSRQGDPVYVHELEAQRSEVRA